MQHTFFVHFFAVVLHDYNVKLPETSWGLFTWRWGTPGRWGNSLWWVTHLSTYTLILIWSRLHDTWGDPPYVTSPIWRPPPPGKQALSCTFYGGNVVRFPVHFFSLPLIFTLHWWPLAFLILSPPLQNFHVVLPTKKCLLCFVSLVLNPCRPFSRWASPAYSPLSLFFCLSLALYSIFVDMTICLLSFFKKQAEKQ